MYIHQHPNEHKHIIPDSVPGFPFHTLVSRLWPFTSFKAQPFGSIMPMHAWSRFSPFMVVVCIFLLAACSDFIHPVNSTPEPTEYSFNYWLLQRLYLYEDELPDLPKDGDSVQLLYNPLTDPYTYYTPPGKESEDKSTKTNTSKIIGGDVGMRYYNITGIEYPIYIARVYPKSPAGRAGIPRYGNSVQASKRRSLCPDHLCRYAFRKRIQGLSGHRIHKNRRIQAQNCRPGFRNLRGTQRLSDLNKKRQARPRSRLAQQSRRARVP